MAGPDDERVMGRISPEAVLEATGRSWEGWLAALDGAGAEGWTHRQIVAHLETAHPEVGSGWWRQSLAVGYERARGKRVTGQTADAGFQVGVRRSADLTPGEAWKLITERPDLWLGEGAAVTFEPGEAWWGPDAAGEMRVVKPGDRLRMTWHPDGWRAPATLQITLTASASGRTAIGVHLERLPHAEAREAMRERWRAALERLVAAAGS